MKALVLKNNGSLGLEDRTEPSVPVLKVKYCSICRTDAKMWQAGQRDLVLPRIPGHEICGSDENGRNYVLWPGSSCGRCSLCLEGRENLCPEMKITGFHTDGGFAEYVPAFPGAMIEIPEALENLKAACLAEPLGCVLNAFHGHEFKKNKRIFVCGAGTLGIMAAYLALSRGAEVTLFEKNHKKIAKCLERFKFPRKLKISDSAEDFSFDFALNAAPGAETFSICLKKLRPGGIFLFFSGISPSDTEIPAKVINEIHYRQLRLEGSYGCTRKNMNDALPLIAENETFFSSLIEKTVSLEQVESVLPDVLSGGKFKFVIDPAL